MQAMDSNSARISENDDFNSNFLPLFVAFLSRFLLSSTFRGLAKLTILKSHYGNCHDPNKLTKTTPIKIKPQTNRFHVGNAKSTDDVQAKHMIFVLAKLAAASANRPTLCFQFFPKYTHHLVQLTMVSECELRAYAKGAAYFSIGNLVFLFLISCCHLN